MARSLFILIISALLCSTAALSHRAPSLNSTISWNERSQHLEITHQIHQHDAQAMLEHIQTNSEDLSSLEHRAHIALLMNKHFYIGNTNDQPLPTKTIGAKLEADYIFVYQELEKPADKNAIIDITLHTLFSHAYTSTLRIHTPMGIKSYQFNSKKHRFNVTLY